MIAALLAASAHGGAWTKEVGEVYVKAGADAYGALSFVAPGGTEASEGSRYFGQQYSVYGETGVLPVHPVQVSVSAPLVVGTHTATAFDAMGPLRLRATTARLGDLRAAVQVALHDEIPIAAAVEAKVPLYANGSVGADIPNYQELFPKPGDGQLDLTGWLFAGGSLAKATFLEGGVGYQHRTEAFVGWDTDITFADSVRFVAKGGRTFGPVLPIVGVEGTVSLGGADDLYTRQFLVASASALIDIAEGLALEPRFGAELWARSASQGLGGGLGVSWRR